MMKQMNYLLDGNNVMYAVGDVWKDVGRVGLCHLLATFIDATGDSVCLVLDGSPPPHGVELQMAHPHLQIIYGLDRSADEVLEDRIRHEPTPSRLIVVSTDHVIRQAARHRRCEWQSSQEFATELVRVMEGSRLCPAAPAEPAEKRTGLSPEQTEQWLRELGVDED